MRMEENMVKSFKAKGGRTTWLRVDRTFPCPICGKTDWCCVNEQQTKAVCMRELDNTKQSYMGGTLYDLYDHQKVDIKKIDNSSLLNLAPANRLHKVYSLVIKLLGLTEEHQEHLMNERGLSAEQIALRGYASAEKSTLSRQISQQKSGGKSIKTIWEDVFLANNLPKDAWRGVPGFSYNEEHQAPVFNVSKHGILIPSRNDWGQIVGIQIRVNPREYTYDVKVNSKNQYRVSIVSSDNTPKYIIRDEAFEVVAEGPLTSPEMTFKNGLSFTAKVRAKYIYVSSSDRNLGTAAASRPHFSFPDSILAQAKFDDEGNSRVHLMSKVNIHNVLVTEGLLKADIISSCLPESQFAKLGPTVVVAMAGVSSWQRVAVQILKYNFQEVYLAFDQDFEGTEQVFERLNDMVQYLTYDKGRISNVLTWETGKGLDDFLLSENSRVEKVQIWSYEPKQ